MQFKYQIARYSENVEATNIKLKESEERFRVIAEHMPNGAVTVLSKDLTVIDATGQDVVDNRSLVDEQLGRNMKEILSPDQFALRETYYNQALSGVSSIFESEYGGEYYFNSISPIIIDDKVDKLIIASQKITGLKKVQDELNSQRELLSSIFDNAPILISMLDDNGYYKIVNKRYEALFGIEAKKVIGLHYSDLLKSNIKGIDMIKKNIDITRERGTYSYTYELTSPKLEQTLFLYTIYTHIMLDGASHTLIMATDVTKQHLAEEELKENITKLNEAQSMLSDSINYALRIQKGVLSSSKNFIDHDPCALLFYRPKSILSGDFYWAGDFEGETIYIAADATGHGVPGAMLTLIGNDFINEIVYSYQIRKPDLILQELDRKFTDLLSLYSKEQIRDGLDVSVVSINKTEKKIEFAGAKSPIYIYRRPENEIQRINGSSDSIGGVLSKHSKAFESHRFECNSGDMVFLGSDGINDQFGGVDGRKKLGRRRLANILMEIANTKADKQSEKLIEKLEEWQGEAEQLDDMLMIGIRI
ncbi:MAG: hypothetical protein Kapaf2KO_00380 [Candidatus Kapaibacteriales bacterium]